MATQMTFLRKTAGNAGLKGKKMAEQSAIHGPALLYS
jgi:hypothetical protein